MKNKGNAYARIAEDDVLAGARRAFKRAARWLRLENARLSVPLITAQNGPVRLLPLKETKR